ALDAHEQHDSPPERIATPEGVDGQLSNVENVSLRHGCSCSKSLPGPCGQNQPMRQMPAHAAPMGAPQGVKMSAMKPTPVASARRNGQSDAPGTTKRWSGFASSTSVTSTSRFLASSPTTNSGSPSSQSG